MSLLPFRRTDFWPLDEFDRWTDHMVSALRHRPYWRDVDAALAHNFGGATGEVVNDNEKFAITMDVSSFRPDELKVNLAGRELTVEGKHEERNDQHGTIQRQFVRKYLLPSDVNLDDLRSSLSEQGKLSLEAPKVTRPDQPAVKSIPIQKAIAH